MNRTLVVRGALAIGVALVLAWIAQHTEWVEETVPGMRQGEALYDEHYALRRLVGLLGGSLAVATPVDALPPTGGVLVLHGWNWHLSADRDAQLRRWVEAGGRLVVEEDVGDANAFGDWTGIHAVRDRRAGDDDDDDDGDDGSPDAPAKAGTPAGKGAPQPGAQSVPATPPPPAGKPKAGGRPPPDDRRAGDGCIGLRPISGETPSDPGTNLWRLCGVGPGFRWHAARAPQLALGTRDGPQLLRLGVGRGSVTVLQGYGHFLTDSLLDGDHARLFVIAAQLRRGDRVQLLDGGQRSSLVGWLWHSAAPLVLALAATVLLCLWGLVQRFGPLVPALPSARRSLRSQVAGSASFLARHGGQQALWLAAWRALRADAGRSLPANDAAEPGRLAEALARRGYLDAAALRRALVHPDLRTPASLADALAAIERARRHLLHSPSPPDPSRGSA